MEPRPRLTLVDETGQPLGERLEDALTSLVPRFHREFPTLRDEAKTMEALERAGQCIARREREQGPVDELPKYAWVALKHVGISWVRLGTGKLAQRTLSSYASAKALAEQAARTGTPEAIEARVLLREVLALVDVADQRALLWRRLGRSNREIAAELGLSEGAVDLRLFRIRQRLRVKLGLDTPRRSQGGRGAVEQAPVEEARRAGGARTDDE